MNGPEWHELNEMMRMLRMAVTMRQTRLLRAMDKRIAMNGRRMLVCDDGRRMVDEGLR